MKFEKDDAGGATKREWSSCRLQLSSGFNGDLLLGSRPVVHHAVAFPFVTLKIEKRDSIIPYYLLDPKKKKKAFLSMILSPPIILCERYYYII